VIQENPDSLKLRAETEYKKNFKNELSAVEATACFLLPFH